MNKLEFVYQSIAIYQKHILISGVEEDIYDIFTLSFVDFCSYSSLKKKCSVAAILLSRNLTFNNKTFVDPRETLLLGGKFLQLTINERLELLLYNSLL